MGKIGVVDAGGGYRGIYATGVLDYCMDHHLHFDVGIGVSAGSANLASYAAGQRGRNYRFYTEFGLRSEYASLKNAVQKHSFVDLDYAYSTLSCSTGECPLDYAALRDQPMDLVVVATDAGTGSAHYFDKRDIRQDDYDVFKASSALPAICQPYPVKGRFYFDGALSDPVPLEKAFAMGCDRVVVLLTKPEDYVRSARKDTLLARRIRKAYPAAAEKLCARAELYNTQVALARKCARQGRALIVAPDDTCGVDTLTRDRQKLDQLYRKGYRDGERLLAFFAAAREDGNGA